jgi:hypothetical protein
VDQVKRLAEAPDRTALSVLPGPRRLLWPLNYAPLACGMAFGYGLRANVREMYQKLADLYEPDDLVYLFGFSRGAFTVRALAGLMHRCGLPAGHGSSSGDVFDDAWMHFKTIRRETEIVAAWRRRNHQRDCRIHFLGIWDTVKSYGGLRPVLLPHLRHNPIVKVIRHALALDEKRGWFNATTWGRLDGDRHNAMTRLLPEERESIEAQDIEEVWFRGCHSDIGGHEDTARIALQWMVGEAAHCGIRLNAEGAALLRSPNPAPIVHESLSRAWSLVDVVPRSEIDNSGVWPARVRAVEIHAHRRPETLLRNGAVTIHESVAEAGMPPRRIVRTRTA